MLALNTEYDSLFREGMMPTHTDDLTANIHGDGDLFVRLKYCKWAVDSQRFKTASSFFQAALKADTWKEAQERFIDLHDDCPLIFARFIQFVYDEHYSTSSADVWEWYGEETLCSETIELKYLVTGAPVDISQILQDERAASDETYFFSDKRIESALKCRKEWRDRDNMPMTNRESDIAADKDRSPAEIHVLMYQLADKYGVPDLQRYAESQLQESLQTTLIDEVLPHVIEAHANLNVRRLFAAMKQVVPGYAVVDTSLKKALACGIAHSYRTIRTQDNEAATKIREWLSSDDELCFMVMDLLAGVKPDELTSIFEEADITL